MASVDVRIQPTGDLLLGGGAGEVVLASDLSLAGPQPSQIQGVLGVVPGTDVQEYAAALDTLAGVASADQVAYSTGAGAYAFTSAPAKGRAVLAGADNATIQAELSLVPGTDVQAFDDHLEDIAALAAPASADLMLYSDAAGSYAHAPITAAGRALIDDADAAAQRATLSLVPGTDVQAQSELLQNIADAAFTDTDLIQYSGAALTAVSLTSLRSQLGIKDNNVFTATTADATQTALNLDTVAASNTVDVEVFVAARNSDSDYAMWRAKFVVFRGATGDGSIVSAQNVTSEASAGLLQTADVSFDVTTGGQLRAQLTGVAATSIDWDVSTRIYLAAH
jgi:hypothetical protein